MSNKVFVYGTLRPGKGDVIKVPGKMYDLGWFPAVTLGSENPEQDTITLEVIEGVTDIQLKKFDQIEGFRENDPLGSLYVRTPFMDGFIYLYHHDLTNKPRVEGGDWLKYTNEEGGYFAKTYGGLTAEAL